MKLSYLLPLISAASALYQLCLSFSVHNGFAKYPSQGWVTRLKGVSLKMATIPVVDTIHKKKVLVLGGDGMFCCLYFKFSIEVATNKLYLNVNLFIIF